MCQSMLHGCTMRNCCNSYSMWHCHVENPRKKVTTKNTDSKSLVWCNDIDLQGTKQTNKHTHTIYLLRMKTYSIYITSHHMIVLQYGNFTPSNLFLYFFIKWKHSDWCIISTRTKKGIRVIYVIVQMNRFFMFKCSSNSTIWNSFLFFFFVEKIIDLIEIKWRERLKGICI